MPGREDPFVRQFPRIGKWHDSEVPRHLPIIDKPVECLGILRYERPQNEALSSQRDEDVRWRQRIKESGLLRLSPRSFSCPGPHWFDHVNARHARLLCRIVGPDARTKWWR